VRVRFFRFVAALLLLLAACSRRAGAPAPAASERPAAVVPPVGLLAELTVAEPRSLWGALKKLAGPRAALLPSSFELVLFSLLDLPPRVAGYVRPDSPVLGVGVAPPGAPAAFVLGVRLSRGSDLVGELASGQGAAFRAERDGSLTVLARPSGGTVLGVVDDWLLASQDERALRTAGVYVARGLGARSLPDAPLTLEASRAALAGPVAAALRERWTALRAGLEQDARDARAARGRAPDFADPSALLGVADGAVGALLELVASTERLRLTVRPEPSHLELAMSLAPVANGALARSIASLEVGGLEPLLGLPSGVILGALSRSSDAERARAAEKPADALRAVLGARLPEKDAAPLAEALRSFHQGRGAVSVFGVFGDRSVFWRQDARDPKELERGLRGLVRALRLPALAEPLEALAGKLTLRESETRAAGVDGLVHRVELAKATAGAPSTALLLHVRGGAATLVAGALPDQVLATLLRTDPSPEPSPALHELAKGAPPSSLALSADLALLRPAAGAAPALAVLGKRGNEGLFELELSAAACAALVDRLGTP
jgi:hypothetical protein